MQTNYEHLKRCVESAPVPPMSRHLYDNMVKLIPNLLKVKYPGVLNELHAEITEEFENNMRKSRGKQFVTAVSLVWHVNQGHVTLYLYNEYVYLSEADDKC